MLTGSDRERYLNGQVTNDVRKLKPGTAMPACVVSIRGKLDGIVLIWNDEAQLIVESDLELGDPLEARLGRYVVADDVELERRDVEAGAEVHVFGEMATKLLDAGRGLRRANRMGIDGIDLRATDLTGLGAAGELSERDIDVLRIENEVPRWGAELTADTLPAEAGLDKTAVDFHKGCYIGQEVVSRVESVGRTNRTLNSLVVEEGKVAAGDGLFVAAGEEKTIGTVTSVAEHFELARPVGLCYIRRGQEEIGEYFTASGSRVKLCELPCE
ncbi:MAG: hypothetical protein WA771_12970 [Chthoniobacterales bacterium]